ncbi:unnamed protein product [Rangifer tarandus platyrhynchus]|uniref:Uncharacterized protein n=2 Tax=Rangifer tarandus platyrhynchus TaxID=3082113 RepID=A0ACB0E501_RANTA|nr:unnamed protein product [Rangifer tarandus platyrhynchus]CAI9695655.1 unnamed protein product [Rangifer tarandus platyrhynchus]
MLKRSVETGLSSPVPDRCLCSDRGQLRTSTWWRGPGPARAAPAPMHAQLQGRWSQRAVPWPRGRPTGVWCGAVGAQLEERAAVNPTGRPATRVRAGSGAHKQLKRLRLSASTPVSPVSQPDSHRED